MSDLQLHDPDHNIPVSFLAPVSPAHSLSCCWHIAPSELREIYQDCATLLPNQPFFESRVGAAFSLTLLALAQFSISSGRIFIFEKWGCCMLPELKTFFYSRQSLSILCWSIPALLYQFFLRSCKLCRLLFSLTLTTTGSHCGNNRKWPLSYL